jgi:hypothetical protein
MQCSLDMCRASVGTEGLQLCFVNHLELNPSYGY